MKRNDKILLGAALLGGAGLLYAANQGYLKTGMQSLNVTSLGSDKTIGPVSIAPLGNAIANCTKLNVKTKQADGTTWNIYDCLASPPQAPQCLPGAGNIRFEVGQIILQNTGAVDGTLYMNIWDDTGASKYYQTQAVVVGGTMSNNLVALNMPTRPYSLLLEVGHI